MNCYICNYDTNEYQKIQVDRDHRVLRGPPKGWVDSPRQIIDGVMDWTYIAYAARDMPGWLMRLVRRGHKMSQKEMGRRLGKSHTTIHYYEQQDVIPAITRNAVYACLQIDHRPGPMNSVVIRRIRAFLGLEWQQLADLLKVPKGRLLSWVARDGVALSDDAKLRLYALYCMMPDLSFGEDLTNG